MLESQQGKIKLAIWTDSNGKEKTISINDYNAFLKKHDKNNIGDFLYNRLYSRYLNIILHGHTAYKNGFSIMANCCLLIETLQSFKNGWGDSTWKSERAFKDFFASENNFSIFKSKSNEFYRCIRCGILHQGETTGGWTINRKGKKLFNETALIIDSIVFANEMNESLKNYSEKLKSEEWDSETWDNFRIKMRKIIENCDR